MNNRELQAAIIELNNILEEMKTLLQWHKLKRFEATQISVSNFMFQDTTFMDLNTKYSQLQFRIYQIHNEIKDSNIPKNKIKTAKKEITKIELQAFYLGSGIRFY